MGELGFEIGNSLNLSKGNGDKKQIVITGVSDESIGGAFPKEKIEAGKMKLFLKNVRVSYDTCFPSELEKKLIRNNILKSGKY